MFVPYTNPHFWTDRNQTLHTSPPPSGRDRRVCMGPQYFTFPTFSTYFVGGRCVATPNRWLPAPHCTATALYPRAGVTSRTVGCAMKTRKSERNECVWKWKPDETGWKWLMNWTCNCIAFIQMITYNLSNLRPSFFRSLSTDNTFFSLLNLSRRSARCFANRMTTQCCQSWQSRVFLCVSAAPVVIYLLRPRHPVSSFLGNVSRTAWQHCDPCFSHGQLYAACSRGGNPTNIYIPAPEGKTKKFSDSVEITNKMQPCNRIYYSTVHW